MGDNLFKVMKNLLMIAARENDKFNIEENNKNSQ
jgi:hypothetical protein